MLAILCLTYLQRSPWTPSVMIQWRLHLLLTILIVQLWIKRWHIHWIYARIQAIQWTRWLILKCFTRSNNIVDASNAHNALNQREDGQEVRFWQSIWRIISFIL